MALNGQRPPDYLPVDHKLVADDIEALHQASKRKDEVSFNFINFIFIIPYIVFRLSFSKS